MSTALQDTLDNIRWNPDLKLSDVDRDIVRNWPTLIWQIKERLKTDFHDVTIMVEGASIIGKGDNRRPLQVLATVSYLDPDGKPGTETLTFMPDAATLYVLYRVVRDEVTQPTLDDIDLHVVEQARIGPGKLKSQSPAGGIIPDNKDMTPEERIAAARATAVQEHIEEGIPEKLQDIIPVPALEDVHALGTVVGNSHTTDKEYQFCSLMIVSPEERLAMRQELRGTTAGVAAETELTKPGIIPIFEAYAKALTVGAEGMLLGLTRALAQLGLLTDAAERFAREFGTPSFSDPLPARDLQTYEKPEIEFDPDYQLDEVKQRAIRESDFLAKRLEECHQSGFTIQKLTIKAAVFDESGNPTHVLERADYWLPGQISGKPSSYHVVSKKNTTRIAGVMGNEENPQLLMQTKISFGRNGRIHFFPETQDLPLEGATNLGSMEGHPSLAMTERLAYANMAPNNMPPINQGTKSFERINLIDAFVRAGLEGAAGPLVLLSQLVVARGQLPSACAALQAQLRQGPAPAA